MNFGGDENFYYLDFGYGFILVYILKNNKCMLCARLIVCQLYLNKTVLKNKNKRAEFNKTLD